MNRLLLLDSPAVRPVVAGGASHVTSTLFGQPASPGGVTQNDTGQYTFGVQFSASAPVTMQAMWWFSPAGALVLPQNIALFLASPAGVGTLVTSQAASWSGAAGSGWVRAPFTSPPSLTASTAYKGCVQKTGASNNWYTQTLGYWSSGAGSGGITSGSLTAPNNAGADGGQNTFLASATLGYPAISSAASNYWLDVEVST